MRELFPENVSFIAQFGLTLSLFKVLDIVQKCPVCKFLIFGESYFQIGFAVSLTGGITWI